jgi:hypothetical protein
MPTPPDQIMQIQSDIYDQEVKRRKQLDSYGLALMMIREGVTDPKEVAREVLAKFGK